MLVSARSEFIMLVSARSEVYHIGQCFVIWIVAVALRADGRLLALLPQPGGEPYGAVAPATSRAALVGLAESWAADA